MSHAQSVVCFVMLAAGSRYETSETNGIAHFSEHMFFKGTKRRPTARDLAAEVDAIGRKGTVRGATRNTFLGYIDHWYKPSRIVLGIGGQLGDGLLGRIEELLGDLTDGPTGSPEPAVPAENGSRVKLHTKTSDQAHLCLGVRSYPLDHPDRYAVQLLQTVLGGGMSSQIGRAHV